VGGPRVESKFSNSAVIFEFLGCYGLAMCSPKGPCGPYDTDLVLKVVLLGSGSVLRGWDLMGSHWDMPLKGLWQPSFLFASWP
jgi:hypothetical protein